ncbi:hypothetical protein PJ985_19300 [Streptomyces sp. ACA25]|nr:hypothetical protein [Streptomyces sp. ACA25]MDB1089706.1 hypothetical protein [Streptomyces sp. ACA25]
MELPRRALLACAAAGFATALSGCAGRNPDGAAPQEEATPGERSAETARLRRRTAQDSAELLARYDAALAAHPALAPALAPLRKTVADQLSVVRSGEPPAPAPDVPGAPAEPAAALAALADAERQLSHVRLRALTEAPPELARLLASLSAAGSVHTYLLNEVRP